MRFLHGAVTLPKQRLASIKTRFEPKTRLVATYSSPLNSMDTYTNYQGLRVLTLTLCHRPLALLVFLTLGVSFATVV
jgi:hypothetical protein